MAREAVEDYYPYPSHVNVANFVSVRLSGRDVYDGWETQMLCLFESHGMLGFIDCTLVKPMVMQRVQSSIFVHTKGLEDNTKSRYKLWRRSDALVKGWILGSLTEEVVMHAVGLLKAEPSLQNGQDITAKELWDKLRGIYGSSGVISPRSQQDSKDKEIQEIAESRGQENPLPEGTKEKAQMEAEEKDKKDIWDKIWGSIYGPSSVNSAGNSQQDSKHKEIQEIAESRGQLNPLLKETTEKVREEAAVEEKKKKALERLYGCTINGDLLGIKHILETGKVMITDKISINGNTALHVAIGTGKDIEFVESLLKLVQPNMLLGMRNSEGSSLLHVAAIVGNSDAARLLVETNQDLLYVEDTNIAHHLLELFQICISTCFFI